MVFIGFSTPRNWNPLSALICAMMKSRASHVWMLVEDPLFKLRLVLEAHTTGFRLISLAEFVKDNKIVALVQPADPARLEQGLPEAGGWLGDQYDVLGLFGIFLVTIGNWFSRKAAKNFFTSSHALFCSEAVVRVLKAVDYPGTARFGNETTNPQQLLTFFEQEPGAKITPGEKLKLRHHLKAVGRKRAQRVSAA